MKRFILAFLLLPGYAAADLVTINFDYAPGIDLAQIKGVDVYLDGGKLDSVDLQSPSSTAETTLEKGVKSFVLNVQFGTHLINLRMVDIHDLDSFNSIDATVVVLDKGTVGKSIPPPPENVTITVN